MSNAANRIGKSIIEKSTAKPITDDFIDRYGFTPFRFIGGPCDGDTMLDSEAFTRLCHEEGGKTFDRSNPRKHGPACFSSCGLDSSIVAVHQYAVDYDCRVYRYVGVVGFIDEREGIAA